MRQSLANAALLLAVVGLPWLGAAAAGHDLRELLEFPPPLAIPTDYPRFSWLAAGFAFASVAGFVAAWVLGTRRQDRPPSTPAVGQPTHRRSRFPRWGWLALVWTLLWWALAWTRFAWFAPLQPFTFFPLWLGFILTVNGLTEARTGTCLLRRSPRTWIALFGVSAGFWWLFEWLNRFVRNWHYLGADEFGAWGYAAHATICFATVLPAVAAVAEWLGSHQSWIAYTSAGPAWPWLASTQAGWALLAAGAASLVLTGVRPQVFYAALWLAPTALLLGSGILAGRSGVWSEMAAGDWRRAATWMVAALVCGFFWELWNWRSLPKWIYTVPGVERWHVFEMPLLGYAGYLPFGLECLLVVERVMGRHAAAETAQRGRARPSNATL